MASTNILVLGAGELGTTILTHLSSLAPQNTNITVLLRHSTLSSKSPSKVSELSHLRSLNISFLPGDVATSSIPELASLFKPYDTIISCLGFASGPGSQIKITTAVLKAGVKRYFPWQFGVDYDVVGKGSAQELWDEQLDVRNLLRDQEGTEWVIVSTGIFMSFLFEPAFGIVDLGDDEKGVTVRALGSWDNKVTATTPEDIGRLTSMIVFEEPRVRNEVLFVAGETVTYARIADVVEGITGRKVKREVWSVEQLQSELRDNPDDAFKKYRVAFAVGRGVSWKVERTWNWKEGVKVMDLMEYAKKFLPGT